MKPTTKVYTFEMAERGNLGDSFRLKTYSDNDDLRPCDFADMNDGALHLPWMKKKELVAWFRKAADLLEKANLE